MVWHEWRDTNEFIRIKVRDMNWCMREWIAKVVEFILFYRGTLPHTIPISLRIAFFWIWVHIFQVSKGEYLFILEWRDIEHRIQIIFIKNVLKEKRKFVGIRCLFTNGLIHFPFKSRQNCTHKAIRMYGHVNSGARKQRLSLKTHRTELIYEWKSIENKRRANSLTHKGISETTQP